MGKGRRGAKGRKHVRGKGKNKDKTREEVEDTMMHRMGRGVQTRLKGWLCLVGRGEEVKGKRRGKTEGGGQTKKEGGSYACRGGKGRQGGRGRRDDMMERTSRGDG